MLKRFFHENPKIALGFSGGVDSTYLLYAAVKYGADVKPYYVKTDFQSAYELRDAKRIVENLGLTLTIIELDLLSRFEIKENNEKRCYCCKKELYGKIIDAALLDGYPIWLDGGNASEDVKEQPERQALVELGVRSPLKELGISKGEVRRLSKEAGLDTWNKATYSCLATRIPMGREITKECLQKVEKAEEILYNFGFTDFQVQLLDDYASIQLPENQHPMLMEKRKEILAALTYFPAVLLDLKAR